jgi:pimeloyl-ACP methyl ester carboxylesterase
MAASPSSLLRVSRMIRAIDVRDVLPTIDAPTLVIQRTDDLITRPWRGRYLADHLPHPRYFEQPATTSFGSATPTRCWPRSRRS